MAENQNSVWKLLQDLSTKPGITEIVINDSKRVFVERGGQFIQLNVSLSKKDIIDFAKELSAYNKKPLNDSHPILDGNLPDGSRVNIIIEPYSKGSPAITIRKYLKSISSFDENNNIFGLNDKWIVFLKALVSSRMNIVISGGTGVGKTTFMNLMLGEISNAQRVVTIEDTLELSLNIPNVVRLETSFRAGESTLTSRDLVKNTLRMRPDRIIIGEVRGGELFDLLQAMNTGHDGSMTSIHANSTNECITRMENLFLMSGFDIPVGVVRRQIAQGVNFIIQLGRDRNGNRVVKQIMELTGMEGNNILTQQLALREDDKLSPTGITPKNMEKLHFDGGIPMNFFG